MLSVLSLASNVAGEKKIGEKNAIRRRAITKTEKRMEIRPERWGESFSASGNLDALTIPLSILSRKCEGNQPVEVDLRTPTGAPSSFDPS